MVDPLVMVKPVVMFLEIEMGEGSWLAMMVHVDV